MCNDRKDRNSAEKEVNAEKIHVCRLADKRPILKLNK
jgi:hypothetical protein